MKKRIIWLLMPLVLGVVACQKDNADPSQAVKIVKTLRMTIIDVSESDGAPRSRVSMENDLTFTWNEGDIVTMVCVEDGVFHGDGDSQYPPQDYTADQSGATSNFTAVGDGCVEGKLYMPIHLGGNQYITNWREYINIPDGSGNLTYTLPPVIDASTYDDPADYLFFVAPSRAITNNPIVFSWINCMSLLDLKITETGSGGFSVLSMLLSGTNLLSQVMVSASGDISYGGQIGGNLKIVAPPMLALYSTPQHIYIPILPTTTGVNFTIFSAKADNSVYSFTKTLSSNTVSPGKLIPSTTTTQGGWQTVNYIVGDPYPTPISPRGVVYDITDGYGYAIGTEENAGVAWKSATTSTLGTTSTTDGAANTATMLSTTQLLLTHPMAQWAGTYQPTAINWYIPARDELSAIFGNLTNINNKLTAIGFPPIDGTGTYHYWSSTQSGNSTSYYSPSADLSDTKTVQNRARVMVKFPQYIQKVF